MHVPDPVISLSITPIKKDQAPNFNKGLLRFQKEDPTFRVRVVCYFSFFLIFYSYNTLGPRQWTNYRQRYG